MSFALYNKQEANSCKPILRAFFLKFLRGVESSVSATFYFTRRVMARTTLQKR